MSGTTWNKLSAFVGRGPFRSSGSGKHMKNDPLYVEVDGVEIPVRDGTFRYHDGRDPFHPRRLVIKAGFRPVAPRPAAKRRAKS